MNHIANSRSGEELSLWEWLGTVEIRIPMMQRDYAQGRKGLHYLRERFLASVFDTLKPCGKSLKLDFVYGEEEKHADGSNLLLVTPIDGQQRLTTLWLIHWYIAMRSGRIKDPLVVKRLQHFTYDTRLSSKEFCKNLVANGDGIEKLMSMSQDPIGVVESIRRQTWYRSSWDCDPTVVGMLTTLSGDCHAPKSCKDGIEKWCEEIRDDAEFLGIWNCLASEPSKCPITFYFQSLEGIGDADGLYVKMNARGKSLTAFENFKAELSDFAEAQMRRDQNAKVWSDVPRKLDTDWSDIFWFAPDDGGIERVGADDRYLAFIRRLVFNDIVTQKNNNGEYQVDNDVKGFSEELRDSTDFYHFFEGRCVYDSFDRYCEAFSRFHKIKSVLDYLAGTTAEEASQLIKACTPVWFGRSQSSWLDRLGFVPGDADFAKDGSFWRDAITQPGRVWFLAIARFFECASALDATVRRGALANWLRVVANIIENADINTMGSMISTMRLIDELSSHSTDILAFLSDPTSKIESGASAEQVKEEREKAVRIKANPPDMQCISEAEGELFYKGMIRHLYRKGGNPDWTCFEARRNKMQDLFRENGSAKKGTVPHFAEYLTKGGWSNGYYKSIYFFLGNSQTTSAGWKRIFRDMHDKDRGGVCRQQLENFIDGAAPLVGDDVITLLIKALGLMENNGSGLQTLVTHVLTQWTAKVGEKDARQYEYVLTDYANRQQRPNNGLFVDLCGTEDGMKAEIARYGRCKGLVLLAEDANDENEEDRARRRRDTTKYNFNGQRGLNHQEMVEAVIVKHIDDHRDVNLNGLELAFPRDLQGPRLGCVVATDSELFRQTRRRSFRERTQHLSDGTEIAIVSEWGRAWGDGNIPRFLARARELGYDVDEIVPERPDAVDNHREHQDVALLGPDERRHVRCAELEQRLGVDTDGLKQIVLDAIRQAGAALDGRLACQPNERESTFTSQAIAEFLGNNRAHQFFFGIGRPNDYFGIGADLRGAGVAVREKNALMRAVGEVDDEITDRTESRQFWHSYLTEDDGVMTVDSLRDWIVKGIIFIFDHETDWIQRARVLLAAN